MWILVRIRHACIGCLNLFYRFIVNSHYLILLRLLMDLILMLCFQIESTFLAYRCKMRNSMRNCLLLLLCRLCMMGFALKIISGNRFQNILFLLFHQRESYFLLVARKLFYQLWNTRSMMAKCMLDIPLIFLQRN